MTDELEIGDDLEITQTLRRAAAAGGTWIAGRLNGHRFEALVFPAHAEHREWELDDSQISKLWIERLADHVTIAHFNRGWDVRPTSDEAQALVDFLAAGLAEHVFGTNA